MTVGGGLRLMAGYRASGRDVARIAAVLGPMVLVVTAAMTGLSACSKEPSIPRDCLGRPLPPGESPAGNVMLSWKTPDNTENRGTPPIGYRVYYGVEVGTRPCQLEVRDAAAETARVHALTPGRWYFSVVSFDANSVESFHSEVVSKSVE